MDFLTHRQNSHEVSLTQSETIEFCPLSRRSAFIIFLLTPSSKFLFNLLSINIRIKLFSNGGPAI